MAVYPIAVYEVTNRNRSIISRISVGNSMKKHLSSLRIWGIAIGKTEQDVFSIATAIFDIKTRKIETLRDVG